MRLVFLGTPADAVPPLQALVAAGHDVALVVTQPDRRRSRGSGVDPSPVKLAAQALGQIGDAAATDAEVRVLREKLASLAVDPMIMTPAEFDAYIKKEVALNTALAKMAGLKANER